MSSFDLVKELCNQWLGKYNTEIIRQELLVMQANNELTIIDCFWGNDKNNHRNTLQRKYADDDTPKLNFFGFSSIVITFCSINTIQLQYCTSKIYPIIESTFLIEIHNKDWLNKWYSRAIERYALRLERDEEIARRANRVNDIIKDISINHSIPINKDFDAVNIISNEYR